MTNRVVTCPSLLNGKSRVVRPSLSSLPRPVIRTTGKESGIPALPGAARSRRQTSRRVIAFNTARVRSRVPSFVRISET